MSVVRDPYFWKRFSVAVHQDEEAAIQSTVASPKASRPELKHTYVSLPSYHSLHPLRFTAPSV